MSLDQFKLDVVNLERQMAKTLSAMTDYVKFGGEKSEAILAFNTMVKTGQSINQYVGVQQAEVTSDKSLVLQLGSAFTALLAMGEHQEAVFNQKDVHALGFMKQKIVEQIPHIGRECEIREAMQETISQLRYAVHNNIDADTVQGTMSRNRTQLSTALDQISKGKDPNYLAISNHANQFLDNLDESDFQSMMRNKRGNYSTTNRLGSIQSDLVSQVTQMDAKIYSKKEDKQQGRSETLHFGGNVHFGQGGDTKTFGSGNVITGEKIKADGNFRLGDNNNTTRTSQENDPLGSNFMQKFDPFAGKSPTKKNVALGNNIIAGTVTIGDRGGQNPQGGTLDLGDITINTTSASITKQNGVVGTSGAMNSNNVTTITDKETGDTIKITGGEVVGTIIVGGSVKVHSQSGATRELSKQGIRVDLADHSHLPIVNKFVIKQTTGQSR